MVLRTHPVYVIVAILFAAFIQYRLSTRIRKSFHANRTPVKSNEDETKT